MILSSLVHKEQNNSEIQYIYHTLTLKPGPASKTTGEGKEPEYWNKKDTVREEFVEKRTWEGSSLESSQNTRD